MKFNAMSVIGMIGLAGDDDTTRHIEVEMNVTGETFMAISRICDELYYAKKNRFVSRYNRKFHGTKHDKKAIGYIRGLEFALEELIDDSTHYEIIVNSITFNAKDMACSDLIFREHQDLKQVHEFFFM